MADIHPPPPPVAPAHRSFGAAAVIVALVVGFGVGFTAHYLATPSRAEVAAEQFCALGQDSGASLLDISGWMTAVQRTNDDWNEVLVAIDDRCPLWRQQVADRADDLGD